jgi:penicillin-binding protein 2
MEQFHLHIRRRRSRGAVVVLVLVLGALVLTFFQTQVIQNPAYALQSEKNRLRPLRVPAPRGTIFDRDGRIVADNVPGYALSLMPAPADSLRRSLQRLAPFLKLDSADIAALMVRQRRHPIEPLLVSGDLAFDQVSAIEERRPLFPEVLIEMRPRRRYPAGPAAAHLVGYVSEISEAELDQPEFKGYEAGQIVGKAGIEREYERRLAGVDGIRYVEVDALGRIVGNFTSQPAVPPVPGKDLRLNIDLDLQEWVAHVFPDTMRGAVAVLQPQTGQVLALYSSPTYDPNEFVGGLEPERWRALQTDSARPMLDRAVAGLYPPGSTWKLAAAAIALKLGVVDPSKVMPIPCRGGLQYGNRYFRCWDPAGHGYLNLAGAITHSCDVYFYQLGLKIGLAQMLSEATRMGFSRTAGVDMPSERAGHFPDSTAWYRRRYGWAPTESEVLSLAIGQGANDQTAIKMAQFYAAIANGGTEPAPHVAADSVAPDEPGWDLHLSSSQLDWLIRGMRGVTQTGGTAAASALQYWDWIGKTGTSQNPHGKDHAWFVGMAGPPGSPKEVVVATIVEQGEHGADAAQYGAKIADYYLRRKYGIPVDTIQTLREYWLAGKPAPWAR